MKKREKAKVVKQLNWRPDFRDTSSLPDIKTVRTSFFVSALALTITVMSLMHVGFHEYSIYSAVEKVAIAKAEIASRQGVHAKAIGMNNQFEEKARRIDEINTLVSDQLIGSDMLIDVSSSLMPGMSLLSVEFNEDKTVLLGYIVANEETDSLLRQYMEKLQKVDTLKDRYNEFTQISMDRQSGSNKIKFHLEATYVDESEDPKKKS